MSYEIGTSYEEIADVAKNIVHADFDESGCIEVYNLDEFKCLARGRTVFYKKKMEDVTDWTLDREFADILMRDIPLANFEEECDKINRFLDDMNVDDKKSLRRIAHPSRYTYLTDGDELLEYFSLVEYRIERLAEKLPGMYEEYTKRCREREALKQKLEEEERRQKALAETYEKRREEERRNKKGIIAWFSRLIDKVHMKLVNILWPFIY